MELIYALSLLTLDAVRQNPVLGVALGSAIALIFNYVANLHWVFGGDKGQNTNPCPRD